MTSALPALPENPVKKLLRSSAEQTYSEACASCKVYCFSLLSVTGKALCRSNMTQHGYVPINTKRKGTCYTCGILFKAVSKLLSCDQNAIIPSSSPIRPVRPHWSRSMHPIDGSSSTPAVLPVAIPLAVPHLVPARR